MEVSFFRSCSGWFVGAERSLSRVSVSGDRGTRVRIRSRGRGQGNVFASHSLYRVLEKGVERTDGFQSEAVIV